MTSQVNSTKRIVAYFSMEIALENAMPSYSGGLGVSLFAHTTPFMEQGLLLPGEPRDFLRGSLGLRYGEP